jgi:hypothetical protein
MATIVLPAFTRSCSTDGEKALPKERALRKEASLRGTKQSPAVQSELLEQKYLFVQNQFINPNWMSVGPDNKSGPAQAGMPV